MILSINDTTQLHNGVEMPNFGFGVYKVQEGKEVKNAVHWALDAGYISIDTASFYGNEKGVGEAIHENDVNRESIFLTTKVWNTEQGYEETLEAFENSRKRLKVDYLDLYLIHWPIKDTFVQTWKALEKLYEDGFVRAIGVSNFHEHHLNTLFLHCNIKPMVNQVELHPMLSQKPLRDFCQQHKIKIEAWSPLARGQLMGNSVIHKIAEKHNKTVAQVIIRWHLQQDIITIPKSVNKGRIIENADVFDFSLTEEEMSQMNQLNAGKRTGTNPDDI